jgi:hypothetical protein
MNWMRRWPLGGQDEVVRGPFLIYHGQPLHIINDNNGPWTTEAACQRWLSSQPHSFEDDPNFTVALKQRGYENLVYGCKLVGEQ